MSPLLQCPKLLPKAMGRSPRCFLYVSWGPCVHHWQSWLHLPSLVVTQLCAQQGRSVLVSTLRTPVSPDAGRGHCCWSHCESFGREGKGMIENKTRVEEKRCKDLARAAGSSDKESRAMERSAPGQTWGPWRGTSKHCSLAPGQNPSHLSLQ